MKIVNLSTNTHGGAGIAALRIHKALLEEGNESYLVVKSNESGFSENIKITRFLFTRLTSRVLNRFLSMPFFKRHYLMYSVFSSLRSNQVLRAIQDLKVQPDLIILHWVADFFNLEDLIKVKENFPEVRFYWYLMDMAPITGGCHYSWGCTKYTKECVSCPGGKNWIARWLVHRNFKRKNKLVNSLEIKFISPNQFVNSQVDLANYSYHPTVSYIPIDGNTFYPSSQKRSLPSILFGTGSFEYSRKGGDLFLKVLRRLDGYLDSKKTLRIEIVMPGFDTKGFEGFRNLTIRSQERVSSDKSLAELYRSTDIFVCCSREDSGPLMLSEAMMSGLVPVSFRVGAASELIDHGYSGYLIDGYDVEEMAYSLLQIVNDGNLKALSRNARDSIMHKASCKSFVESIKELP